MSRATEYYHRTSAHLVVDFDPDGPGYVYLMTSKWIDGLVKIGSSRNNPYERVKYIQVPGAEVAAIWRENPPWRLERRLHACFREQRVDGEWFSVDPISIITLVDLWLENPAEMWTEPDLRVSVKVCECCAK